jgi:mono/diheme cytochrome c family protein
MRILQQLVWTAASAAAACISVACAADETGLTFEGDIRPLFRTYCFDCHGATEKLSGELDLRLVHFMEKGGDSGPAIVKGDAAGSYLLQRVKEGEMPPGEHRVPEDKIAILQQWIQEGAKTVRPEPASIGPGLGVSAEERAYWAFQTIVRPAVPTVNNADRVRTPIDALLLAAMQQHNLHFAADADRQTLIRRAALDLTGLPPTTKQIQQFLDDTDSDAWEKAIDRLLASKHYGERWGRHWLDIAGYADSEGYSNSDQTRKWAFQYRDWVINAFNNDMAMDQFIVWQLAGDELVTPPYSNMTNDEIARLTATGFLRMVADGTGQENKDVVRNQVVTDTIKMVSTSLLGLSVGCAQCHDHRYDPISQEDYYRIRAVFEPALDPKQWHVPSGRAISLYTDEDHAQAAEIEKQAAVKVKERSEKQSEYMAEVLKLELDKVEESKRALLKEAHGLAADKRTAEHKKALADNPNIAKLSPGVLYQYNQDHADKLKEMDADIAKIRAAKPEHKYVRAVTEKQQKINPTLLFYRGDYRQPQHEVKPGGLTVAAAPDSPLQITDNDPSLPSSGRRLAYARYLTSGRHPLVARVLVNRFWMLHFGKGLVSTTGEFGKLGTKPSNPELLDWLADEFMSKGWSLKHLHRKIMTSTVYRQQARRTPQADSVDSSNQLHSHFPVHRLEAETIRDSILAVSGRLDKTQFGPAVEVSADATGQIVIMGDSQRRSIYVQVRRTQPVAILKSFDAPDMEVNCTDRSHSTVATQSLMLMNSEFILGFSKAFAERLNEEAAQQIPLEDVAAITYRAADSDIATLNPWRYGYGAIDETEEDKIPMVTFADFPYFGKGRWSGSKMLPDEVTSFSLISATGGHAALPKLHPIRRWTSPVQGKLQIKGTLNHGTDNGDGIRLSMISSRQGLLGRWVAHNSTQAYELTVDVEVGDIIDAVVDAQASHTSDSFSNRYEILIVGQDEDNRSWDSTTDFHGPLEPNAYEQKATVGQQLAYGWLLAYGRRATAEELQVSIEFIREQLSLLRSQNHKTPLSQAMTNYCQALLGSNQFLYIE